MSKHIPQLAYFTYKESSCRLMKLFNNNNNHKNDQHSKPTATVSITIGNIVYKWYEYCIGKLQTILRCGASLCSPKPVYESIDLTFWWHSACWFQRRSLGFPVFDGDQKMAFQSHMVARRAHRHEKQVYFMSNSCMYSTDSIIVTSSR